MTGGDSSEKAQGGAKRDEDVEGRYGGNGAKVTDEGATVVAGRVVVREERVVLDNKFRFGADIEEFFLLLESRCSARSLPNSRYLQTLVENCDDISHLAVGEVVKRFESVACPASRYLRVRDELLVLYGPRIRWRCI
eukprot:Trichotokara_eunicae@DN6324_c0_g1_i1.p1